MTVGRNAEREALASFVDDLSAGPTAVLLEGEPGIGKSTLWTEGVELARAHGCVVLSCRPSGSDTELAFVGLGDLLRGVADEWSQELPALQREALDVALLRRSRGSRRPDPHAVSVATLGVVQSIARTSALVLAVDDAHALDTATARALAFVVRRLSDEPVGVLIARSDIDAPPPLGVADAFAPGRLRRLPVGPLGADELGTLVRAHVGVAMSISEAKRLRQISGGNPFFALEIARAAARGDQGVTGQSLPIPRSLRDDVLRHRLGTLPTSTLDLLLVAAAAGRPTLDLLGPAGDERIGKRLQPAIDAGIIQVLGVDLRFTHPIYRSAIYAQASRSRRHAVHRQLAELMSDPEERARHLALSADAPDEGIAQTLEEAARVARDRGSPDAAADLLEHAIRLTPVGAAPSVRRRHLEAADQRLVAGDTEAASNHATEALRLSSAGPERAESLRRIAAIDLERGRIADARRALETASTEADEDDHLLAAVDRDLAALLSRSDLVLAERHAAAATERAERSGDLPLLLAARTTLARISLLLGNAADVLEWTLGLDETERPGGDEPDLVVAEADIIAGEHERARGRLERTRATAVERGDEPGRRSALVRLAELELRDGAWDRAESLADEARSLARQLGVSDAMERGLLASVAALRGRAEEAREHAELGLRGAGDDRLALMWSLGALGALELSIGRSEVALRHLGRAGGIATAIGVGEPAALPFLSDEAEALVGAGELAAAQDRIAWLEQRGKALDRGSALGAAARCRGLLLAETGALAEALASLHRATELYERLPLPFETARSLLTLGTLRRRDRQKRAARESLEQSVRLFDALGAAIWAGRAREELARISGRRTSLTELTESEARVVRLAASALTNREIARTLSMSVRTVEGHLSHAYAKLGVRSRTELAVFFDRSD